ncbi:GumC family protein [Natroniella sp. ANB-PHB2]|uniref:GumC family protein n=1 Tax=Natroniella sp. ANB-PHB2 TaxID=3384444 RepID=UPI0038D4A4B9
MNKEVENVDEMIEIDLREYLKILIERKGIIIGVTLLAVLISGVVSFLVLDPVYEAEADLMIVEPDFTTDYNAGIFNSNEYRQLLMSQDLASQVLEELELDGEYRPGSLVNSLSWQIEDDSSLVNLTYQTTDLKRGEEILATWVDLFEERSLELLLNRVRGNKEQITEQYESYQVRLDKVDAEYDQFQKENRIELIRNRIRTRERSLVDLEARLTEVENEIRLKEVMVDSLTEILAGEEQIHELRKAIFEDEALSQLNQLLEGNQITSEELNPLYIEFRRRLRNEEASLEQLRVEKENLTADLKKVDSELVEFKSELVVQERRLEKLEEELSLVKSRYDDLIQRREDVTLAEEIQTNGLEVVNQAVISDIPVAPNKKLNLAIAAVLGLMLGLFMAFMAEFLSDWDKTGWDQSTDVKVN